MSYSKMINLCMGVFLLALNGHSFAQFKATFNLSDLNGQNGFVVNAEDPGDSLGAAVSYGGDLNNDGIDDIILGVPFAKIPDDVIPPQNYYSVGKAYVLLGSVSGFPNPYNLSDFVPSFHGGEQNDEAGRTVSAAGDVNGDGFEDILISANGVNPVGQVYVWYGGFLPFAPHDLSDISGLNGFTINLEPLNPNGIIRLNTAGDFNDDGIDDIIIGYSFASPGGKNGAGKTYVIFGNDAAPTATPVFINLADLDGTNGVMINGELAGDISGSAVSSAGDLNGDNIDDIIIGAPGASRSNPNNKEGRAYVVFGSSSAFTSPIELSALNGTNGFIINNGNDWDRAGTSVSSIGDVNHDGLDDIIIGVPEVDPFALPQDLDPGSSYVIYGSLS
ncbi:MAG: integrin alpha, partial [Proteobacteria bacterium]|nr:integrin alpha [Pseudomonadota bacterium]